MTWDAISALAELAGALAVVVTLLYLAAQIRQNTAAVRGATFQGITDSAVAFNDKMAAEPEAVRVFGLGASGSSELDPQDAVRFHSLMLSLVRRGENLHYQTRMGLLDDSEWAGLRASIVGALSAPGARRWCAENAQSINPHFRAFLETHCGPSGPLVPAAAQARDESS